MVRGPQAEVDPQERRFPKNIFFAAQGCGRNGEARKAESHIDLPEIKSGVN